MKDNDYIVDTLFCLIVAGFFAVNGAVNHDSFSWVIVCGLLGLSILRYIFANHLKREKMNHSNHENNFESTPVESAIVSDDDGFLLNGLWFLAKWTPMVALIQLLFDISRVTNYDLPMNFHWVGTLGLNAILFLAYALGKWIKGLNLKQKICHGTTVLSTGLATVPRRDLFYGSVVVLAIIIFAVATRYDIQGDKKIDRWTGRVYIIKGQREYEVKEIDHSYAALQSTPTKAGITLYEKLTGTPSPEKYSVQQNTEIGTIEKEFGKLQKTPTPEFKYEVFEEWKIKNPWYEANEMIRLASISFGGRFSADYEKKHGEKPLMADLLLAVDKAAKPLLHTDNNGVNTFSLPNDWISKNQWYNQDDFLHDWAEGRVGDMVMVEGKSVKEALNLLDEEYKEAAEAERTGKSIN